MHGQVSCLAEGSRAALIVALERFLLRVDVGVLFQVLSQRERLEAEDAHVLLDCGVRSDVSPQREPSCI